MKQLSTGEAAAVVAAGVGVGGLIKEADHPDQQEQEHQQEQGHQQEQNQQQQEQEQQEQEQQNQEQEQGQMQHTPLSVITTVLHEEEKNYSSSSPSSTTSTATSTPTPTSSSASISTSFLFPSVEASVSPLNESQEKSMHLSTAVTSSPTGQQLSPTPTINLSNNNSNAPKKRGSTHKVKSSRRASFQLSNTVNNLAKESGVDHLIGIVDGGEKKKGMRDQINDLKEEIEKKGGNT
jgi:hypothetical protein